MARNSTAKFTTFTLSIPNDDEVIVQVYYKKNPVKQTGTFITKADSEFSKKGKRIFIRFYESTNIELIYDKLKADIESQLEPRVEYSAVLRRDGEFRPVQLADVVHARGESIKLSQEDKVYAAKHEGKVYTFVRPGHYPLGEGIELTDPENKIVEADSADLKELQDKVDDLHAQFYEKVFELWEEVVSKKSKLMEKFKKRESLSDEQDNQLNQLQPVFDEILSTYSKQWS